VSDLDSSPETPRRPANVCWVLGEDRELAEAVAPAERQTAVQECTAREIHLPRGCWSAGQSDVTADGIGFLVLDGLLMRRIGIGGLYGAELLGRGDILRPWQGEDVQPSLPSVSAWTVLQPARLAVLDPRASRRLARYPPLTARLVARALERSRNLAINMTIVHHYRVETRLHMLFWHLADRWGRVRTDGVALPLRLTHSILADLVCARRSTVTGALSELKARGVLQGDSGEWLLIGEPPSELLGLDRVGVGARSRAID